MVMKRCCQVVLVAGFSLLGTGFAMGGDVQLFGVVKLHQFEQTVVGPPKPAGETPYSFQALVVGATNHAVTAATVKAPGSLPERTLVAVTNGLALAFEERFTTASALDATYPSRGGLFNASTYAFTVTTVHDGTKSANVSYFGALFEPPVAEILDLSAAQAVDTSTDFVLRWKPLNGTFLDLVQVAITGPATNVAFASPLPFAEGALNPNSEVAR
jgi:hypothetical protein